VTLTQQDDAVSLVENEVRELVRRRGLDPVAQPGAVRRLVEDVIADYEDRSLSGPLPSLGERQVVGRHVYDAVAGLGPLQRFLDDPEVEEVWINEPGRVFVARGGRSELTTAILTTQQVADLVERMLKTSGRRLDVSSPFVDARLPDGSRLHVVNGEVTGRHLAVNVRKFVLAVTSLDELVRLGSITPEAARFLEASIVTGLNVVVAGGTQAGKTTMLNALCGAIPANERVISCEEVFELQLPAADWVPMQTRQPSLEGTGEIRLRRLVVEALRMRPDRLIVGEVRQEEALDLLIALNAGLPGMASIHANSAREAVTKLCTLPLLAGENVSAGFVMPTVAASVDLVVHVTKEASGRRRVTEIAALSGRCERDVVEVSQVFRTHGSELVRADGFPPHADRFLSHGYDPAELLAGEAF
jgi:pilus assembly protein CpaF